MKNTEVEKRIDGLLAEMTLREKIGQLNQLMLPADNSQVEKVVEEIRKGNVGSLILATSETAGNGEEKLSRSEILEFYQKIAVEESRLGIPIIYGRDVIHGHHTVLPIPLGLAASFDGELVKEAYRCVAREAAADGVQWTFAPMLDNSHDPRWGRIIESAGEDPFLGEQMAKAVVEGFQGDDLSKPENIAACAKHFIGYGASEGGRDYTRVELSEYSLRNFYLGQFRAAVNAGVQTVMSSFNDISGVPVSVNKHLLTDVLKEELGFDGFVVSDWGSVSQLVRHGVAENQADCAKLSLNAGIDMDMVDCAYIDHLEKLVEQGEVELSRIDDAVRRILRVKLNCGIFENPYPPKLKIDSAKHRTTARKMAADCMVLLKNNGVLPLSADNKISVLGPMMNEQLSMLGSWALDGNPDDVTCILNALKNKAGSNIICDTSPLLDQQRRAGNGCDTAVLCLGESSLVTGERNSLANIDVPDFQVELARNAKALGKKVIAVLSFGRPVGLEKLEPFCDAMLYTWHPGTEAGEAIADILYGDTVPSGRLPITLPRTTGQIPLYYNFIRSGKPADGYYGEGMNYSDCSGTPMYPFGYGLSYTEFKYSAPKADKEKITLEELKNGGKFKISVDIENIGKYDGKELVQAYVFDSTASMSRPIRELKAYKKAAIKKGEKLTVNLELGYEAFAFYNAENKYVSEKGKFSIFIGKDCLAPHAFVLEII